MACSCEVLTRTHTRTHTHTHTHAHTHTDTRTCALPHMHTHAFTHTHRHTHTHTHAHTQTHTHTHTHAHTHQRHCTAESRVTPRFPFNTESLPFLTENSDAKHCRTTPGPDQTTCVLDQGRRGPGVFRGLYPQDPVDAIHMSLPLNVRGVLKFERSWTHHSLWAFFSDKTFVRDFWLMKNYSLEHDLTQNPSQCTI